MQSEEFFESSDSLIDTFEDLCSRFIVNLPQEELSSFERICIHIELAFWYYIDVVQPVNPSFPTYKLVSFAQQIFNVCPLLVKHKDECASIMDEFIRYKFSVPTYGAIIMSSDKRSVLLVTGMKRRSWNFPGGKINKDEAADACAIRETLEEVGYDITSKLSKSNFIGIQRGGHPAGMYVIPGVPLNTDFQPQTVNEIGGIKWVELPKLFREVADHSSKYFNIVPYIKPFKSWLRKRNIDFGEAPPAESRPAVIVDMSRPGQPVLITPAGGKKSKQQQKQQQQQQQQQQAAKKVEKKQILKRPPQAGAAGSSTELAISQSSELSRLFGGATGSFALPPTPTQPAPSPKLETSASDSALNRLFASALTTPSAESPPLSAAASPSLPAMSASPSGYVNAPWMYASPAGAPVAPSPMPPLLAAGLVGDMAKVHAQQAIYMQGPHYMPQTMGTFAAYPVHGQPMPVMHGQPVMHSQQVPVAYHGVPTAVPVVHHQQQAPPAPLEPTPSMLDILLAGPKQPEAPAVIAPQPVHIAPQVESTPSMLDLLLNGPK